MFSFNLACRSTGSYDSGADCSSSTGRCQRREPASDKRAGVRMALAAIAYPLL
jgi:hypothetical protein